MVDVDDRSIEAGGPPQVGDEGTVGRKGRGRRRLVMIIVGIVAAVVVYAFAFEKTDVTLEEIKSETRQEQLFRILRALAHPDLITYELDETTASTEVLLPCNSTGPALPAPDISGLVLTATPGCADPGSTITISGSGFEAERNGRLAFIPESEFTVSLSLERFETDSTGAFEVQVELPDRAADVLQTIEATTSENIGSLWNFINPFDSPTTVWDDANNNGIQDPAELVTTPRWSINATRTLEKIIETVMLALLATTVGTALAVPLSFFAARNLMRDITTPILNLALTLIALPIGVFLGILGSRAANAVSDPLVDNLAVEIVGLVVLPLVMVWTVRWAVPRSEETEPTPSQRLARSAALLGAAIVGILTLIVLSAFALDVGGTISRNAGALGFLGNFLARLGEILDVSITLLSAMIAAFVMMTLGTRLAYWLRSHLARSTSQALSIPLTALAGGLIGIGIGAAIQWFAQFDSRLGTFWIPLTVGSLVGLTIAARAWTKESVGIGLPIYYLGRTLFNTLRSVEPLVMVIVFVVWVGIGPFAGALALALHTTASLAKLYSEQVESIMTGPIEAIRATGATRVQTIVYAVVPQVVPPYISFTMYRWDINVRMSTIIGFAGGGGIGLLLQQNINLLQYQAAAAQMLAIAIVVATMDYISSRLRERLV